MSNFEYDYENGHPNDTGNPSDYEFCIDYSDDYMPDEPGNPSLVLLLSPKGFWDKHGNVLCQHMKWEHPEFEQMMEASYVTTSFSSPEELLFWALKEGFIPNESLLSATNNIPSDWWKNVSMQPQSVSQSNSIKCKGSKFETAELVDLIVNKFLGGILRELSENHDEEIGLNKTKNWKRAYKKKMVLGKHEEVLDGIWPSYEFEVYYSEGNENIHVYNKPYMNNQNNIVTIRYFELKTNEEVCVVILTDAKDQEIVAVIANVD